jgi:hypothetical protein
MEEKPAPKTSWAQIKLERYAARKRLAHENKLTMTPGQNHALPPGWPDIKPYTSSPRS